MFFVFNKDKAISYVVTVFTVAILFVTASVFSNSRDTVQTSTNQIKNFIMNNVNILPDEEVENIN